MKKIIIILLCIGAFILSCTKSDDSKSSSGFDRSTLTESLATSIIDDNLSTLISRAEAFNTCVESVKTNENSTSYDDLKDCWKSTAKHWQLSRFFMIKDLKYSTQEQVYAYWPINQTKIEEHLSTNTPISQSWIQNIGSNQKGIYTLEYLIFTYNWDDVTNNPKILDYISSIAQENVKATQLLKSTWDTSYKSKFIESTDNFVTSSIPIITNRIIEYAEYAKNEKLGYPLGIVKYTTIDANKLESIYAQYSIELMIKNLDIIEHVYLGGQSESIIGYDDYLLSFGQQGEDLDGKIKAQMSTLRNQLNLVPKPAFTNLATENSAYLQLYEEWKELIKLFKTEFISLMEVTPTFSDGDGD